MEIAWLWVVKSQRFAKLKRFLVILSGDEYLNCVFFIINVLKLGLFRK